MPPAPSLWGLLLLVLTAAENYLQRQYAKHAGAPDDTPPVLSVDPLAGMTWRSLRFSGGLRNLELAVLVVSRWAGEERYLGRILPAADTWMRLLANVFVVLEDTVHVRYAFRSCQTSFVEGYTAFSCDNEPTVVLTSACSHLPLHSELEYSCKIDELVHYISWRGDIFSDLRFAVVTSDEYYFRVDVLFRWLGFLERSDANRYPLLAFDAGARDAHHLQCRSEVSELCSSLSTFNM